MSGLEFDGTKIGDLRRQLTDFLKGLRLRVTAKIKNVQYTRDEAMIRVVLKVDDDWARELADHLAPFRELEFRPSRISRTAEGNFSVILFAKIKEAALKERDELARIAELKGLSMDPVGGFRLVGYVPGEPKPFVLRRVSDNEDCPAGVDLVEKTFGRKGI